MWKISLSFSKLTRVLGCTDQENPFFTAKDRLTFRANADVVFNLHMAC